MWRDTRLLGCSVLAGLAAAVLLANACLLQKDPFYCADSSQCPSGYVCDTAGMLPAAGGHGNTCIRVGDACAPACAGAEPVCEDINTCRACTHDDECSALESSLLCHDSGACVRCLQNEHCGDESAPLCDEELGACVQCLSDADCGDDGRCRARSVCVQCLSDADCSEPLPRCGSDNTCMPECSMSGDCRTGQVCQQDRCAPCSEACDSGLCERGGECVAVEEVTYVGTEGTDDDTCGAMGQPCRTLSAALERGTAWILVGRGEYTESLRISAARSVRIVGQEAEDGSIGVILEAEDGEPAIHVNNAGVDVHVEGLAVVGTSDATTASVRCRAAASLHLYRVAVTGGPQSAGSVLAESGCELTLERTLVRENPSVGVLIYDSPLTIQNSIIVQNGDHGVRLEDPVQARAILRFNTIADNENGLSCSQPLSETSHNIVWNNENVIDQMGGCVDEPGSIEADFSIIRHRDSELDPMLDADYRPEPGSPAIDRGAAAPPPGVTEDFDGEKRPYGDRLDIGAYERWPSR